MASASRAHRYLAAFGPAAKPTGPIRSTRASHFHREPALTLQQILLALKARRWIVIGVFAAVFGLTLAASLLMTRQYTATATVIADAKAPDPVYGMMVQNSGGMLPGYIATQIDIITSERIRLRVVHMLGIDTNAQAHAKWLEAGEGKGTLPQYYAALLDRNLVVKPSRESNVIAIQFTSPDPAFAAAAANAFAKAYIDTAGELRADPAKTSSEFFEARSRQAREAVEAAQAKLSAYQQQHGITATDERVDVESARLAELSTQLTVVQALRGESASRAGQARGRIGSSPDVLQNPVVQQLRSQVALAEAKLRELANQYGVNHPNYQGAKAELDGLKARLQIEMQQVAGSVGTSNAVNVQREAQLNAALDAQKKKVLQLRAQHDEIAVLQRDVEAAQKAYDLVAQRLSQTSLESQNQQTNITMLSDALPPFEPSRPRLLLNLLVATVVGLFLGLWTALAFERFDHRLRSRADAERAFGVPVLAALPGAAASRKALQLAAPARRDRRSLRDWIRRLGPAGA